MTEFKFCIIFFTVNVPILKKSLYLQFFFSELLPEMFSASVASCLLVTSVIARVAVCLPYTFHFATVDLYLQTRSSEKN
jgi:hypothetical protein